MELLAAVFLLWVTPLPLAAQEEPAHDHDAFLLG